MKKIRKKVISLAIALALVISPVFAATTSYAEGESSVNQTESSTGIPSSSESESPEQGGSDTPDNSVPESGTPDSIVPDVSTPESSVPDSSTPDGGTLDTGRSGLSGIGPMSIGTPSLINPQPEIRSGMDTDGNLKHDVPVEVRITFGVPVAGDGGTHYYEKNDTVTLPLSENFKFDPVPGGRIDLRDSDNRLVGHVTLQNNSVTGNAEAYIEFDGDDAVFNGTFQNVLAEFDATLKFNGTSIDNGDGTNTVRILEKDFKILVPGDTIEVSVAKASGTVDVVNGTIEWTVTVDALNDKDPREHIDLGGYEFVDELTGGGTYVGGTAAISPWGGPFTPSWADGDSALQYTFPSGVQGPQTITFKTKIPDDVLTNGGTVANTAKLTKDTQEFPSNTVTVTVPGPKFTKTGVAGNEGSAGSYNPTDRTITWYVNVDSGGRNFNDLEIVDPLDSDLTVDSAVWQTYTGPLPAAPADLANDVNWTDSAATWSGAPANGEYTIGDFNGIGRLKIVSIVPNPADGISVGITRYNNRAAVNWESDGGTPGTGTTSEIGVGVGYNTITKSAGTADTSTKQIPWTINVDLQGQSAPDLAVYDLIIHDKNTSDSVITGAASWPAGLTIGSTGVHRNNGQKYVSGTATGSSGLTVTPIELYDGGDHIGTLIQTTGLSNSAVNTINFTTQVLDPDILAGNGSTSNQTKVNNTVTLHTGTKRLGAASANADFPNQVLSKEMLHRNQVGVDHETGTSAIDANNRTINAADGFHYGYKEAIFRLNVNAMGIDFTSVETNLSGGFGPVTITDTLPAGWEFAKFEDGQDFLIYEGGTLNTGSGYPGQGSLQTTGSALNPSTIDGGLTSNFTTGDPQTATFTFNGLNKPYVILVKAKPTNDKLEEYLVGANTRNETNTLSIHSANWTPGKQVTRDIQVNSTVLKKTLNINATEGIAEWTVDYTPLDRAVDTGLEDTLPPGIDLRTDSHGQLIWTDSAFARNINVRELVRNADGTYTPGAELALPEIQNRVTYDAAERKLTFMFPDNTKAYRLTYITDITGAPGRVDNSVKLINKTGTGTESSDGFEVLAAHGRASMSHSGFVLLRKTASDGTTVLSGAKFTLYNTNPDGSKAAVRAEKTTDSSGEIAFYGLAPGEYVLEETQSPTGYQSNPIVYKVLVGDDRNVTIDKLINPASGNDPFIVKNYLDTESLGGLTLSKTVAGNAGNTDEEFTFTVDLTRPNGLPDDGTYSYNGNGVPDGTITSGGTVKLKDGQSIEIINLLEGTGYTITEQEANQNGYISVGEGRVGTISENVVTTVEFTNTRNIGQLNILKLVEGNAGDTTKEFTFEVNFTLPGGGNDNSSYLYIGTGIADGTISSGDTIELSHGQAITIQDLPTGTGFTVTEQEANQDGYITSAEGDTGTIAIGEPQTAVFTNTKNLGTLNISKTVAGNAGETNKKFTFAVSLTTPDGDEDTESYPYTGVGVPDGTIASGDTIKLAHGQSITIRDLPIGTEYTVTESEANKDGYATTVTGGTGTITVSESATFARFTNTKDSSTPTPGKGDPKTPTKETTKKPTRKSGIFPKTGDSLDIGALGLGTISIALIVLLAGINLYKRKRINRDK